MIIVNKYELDFKCFLTKFIELLANVVGGDVIIGSQDFSEMIDELVILAHEYGLQYGLNHRFRRCNSEYIKKTESGVNIIDLKTSFTAWINGMLIVQKAIIECKKVFLCGKLNIEDNLTSILYSEMWVPGTLTNSQYTLKRYKFYDRLVSNRGGTKQTLPISVIISVSPAMYPVISREVLNMLNREIIFDVNRGKKKQSNIHYIGLVDTNINAVTHTNITNVCVNGYSRYTKKLFAALFRSMLELISKKQISA